MDKRSSIRPALAVVLLFTLTALVICCQSHSASTYSRLRNYVDTIKVVNAHEHQRWFAEHQGHPYKRIGGSSCLLASQPSDPGADAPPCVPSVSC